MARIFFAGIKHSGKTGMAKLVSAMSGLPCADSDDLILPLIQPMSVREFYKTDGKVAFMEKEAEAVREYISSHDSFIISLGGGACDNSALTDMIRSNNGRIVYLKRPENSMLPVILKHGVPAFLDPDDIEGSFHEVYERRDAMYRKVADLIIDLGPYGDKAEAAVLIAGKLKENGYV